MNTQQNVGAVAPHSPEVLEAARFYAPNSERLQRAFLHGYTNGEPANGMSVWERTAAVIGARRAALEQGRTIAGVFRSAK